MPGGLLETPASDRRGNLDDLSDGFFPHLIGSVKAVFDETGSFLHLPVSYGITVLTNRINVLQPKPPAKGLASPQASLRLGIEKDADIGGIGMGVLSDGTPYLNQRGLASLCGVQNRHIGDISAQWTDAPEKPRIAAIRSILRKVGADTSRAHIEVAHRGVTHYCYPAEICLAVLEYYSFDAGVNCSVSARDNFRILAGSKLREMIYSQLGYDPSGSAAAKFDKWHERIALNYQSAPRGYFHVFNEANTIIYELILAGAPIGDKMVVDISVGRCWSDHWDAANLQAQFGMRDRYPHRYPDSHPQSKSNPQTSWCYPLAALGYYREWLQAEYLEGGKFKAYLKGKVSRGELPPSIAELAIETLTLPQLTR